MAANAEIIKEKEKDRLANLRHDGAKNLKKCLQNGIKDKPVIDRIALLADTGQLDLFYEAIGQARLEGYSWKMISTAATGESMYGHGHSIQLNYKSYCMNNNIEPVKVRKSTN